MRLQRTFGVLLALLASCYNSNGFKPCALTCAGTETCFDGTTCADGYCGGAVAAAACVGPGSEVMSDGSVPDAKTTTCTSKAGLPGVLVGSLVHWCFDDSETPNLEVDGMISNTANTCTESLIGTGGDAICVIVAEHITVAQTLDLGMLDESLALIARDKLDIKASIDASSKTSAGQIARIAGGANSASCGQLMTSAPVPGTAGGTFGGAGGSGGAGFNGVAGGMPNGVDASFLISPFMRGGCPAESLNGATAAPSGGAIYLASGGSLTLDAPLGALTIDASGAAGFHGENQLGGGGGASGGLIVLEAPMVSGSAILVANGGGGGGINDDGDNGGTGAPDDGLGGDSGTGANGTGGNGSVGSNVDGDNGVNGETQGQGGGGGGGGAGFIEVLGGGSPTIDASPPLTR